MEKSQASSFIPKGPVRGTVKPKSVRKVYILTYVSYVLFFGTVLAAMVVFGYGLRIDSQLAAEKSSLFAERESFNQSDLERLRELEFKMNTALSLLDRHVSLHSVLVAMEATTVGPVQIYGLEYIKDINNSLNLILKAKTENFNNALFQREIFASDSVLAGASVSEIEFTQSRSDAELFSGSQEVNFTLSKILSASEIPYTGNSFSFDGSPAANTSVVTDVLFTESDPLATDGVFTDSFEVTDVSNE